jgi:hypothetical protein
MAPLQAQITSVSAQISVLQAAVMSVEAEAAAAPLSSRLPALLTDAKVARYVPATVAEEMAVAAASKGTVIGYLCACGCGSQCA